MFNVGSFGYVVMALMGMFLVGRHTRADEEAGRTELLRATVLGRNAPVTAVLVVAAGAFAVLGGADHPEHAEPGPSHRRVGRSTARPWAASACCSPASPRSRPSSPSTTAPRSGSPAHCSAPSYVLRAVGDVGDGTLSWLSPMGWAQAARPYAGERWWTLLLLAGAAIVCVAVAFVLLGLRDLGGGLVPPRPGPPVASTALVGITLRPAVPSPARQPDRRGRSGSASPAWRTARWARTSRDLIGNNNAFEDIIAQGGGSLTDAFFTTSLLLLALIAGGFAISSTLRLRSEETGGRAEPLLATGCRAHAVGDVAPRGRARRLRRR